MNINIRSLAICVTTSLLLSACASLQDLKTEDASFFNNKPVNTKPVVTAPVSSMLPPETTQAVALPGDRPLAKAQQHFHEAEYGLAEKYFRRASLDNPKNLDAWLGLAASYDQLKRFDLANNSYRRAAKLNKRSIDVLNNWGYSYLLRGNMVAAREKFLKAYEIDPKNKTVNANLDILREGIKRNRRKNLTKRS